MEQKINIAEILKDAPKRTKLWSPVCGEIELDEVVASSHIKCIAPGYCGVDFDEFGRSYHYSDLEEAECLLFPSKENRDWSTFKVPWKPKHFEPFQRVLVRTDSSDYWRGTLYSNYIEGTNTHLCTNGCAYNDASIIPFKGNEDKLGKVTD